MYRTCLHCHGDLGANELIERFPVGRRIAYDPERGRLWVICGRCRRWNLSPLETRWEALEECERLFSGLRRRTSTGEVTLAWAPGGVRLVRIGRGAGVGEFAAWRYGRSLLLRQLRRVPIALGVLGGAGLLGASLVGGGWVWAGWTGMIAVAWVDPGEWSKRPLRVRLGGGDDVLLRRWDIREMRITRSATAPYQVRVLNWHGLVDRGGPRRKKRRRGRESPPPVSIQDDHRLARAALGHLNRFGASRDRIGVATGLIEEAGGSEAYLAGLAARGPRIVTLPPEQRLAFEMAFSEDRERAALEGELQALEAEWRDAEAIARIADKLGLPGRIAARLRAAGGGAADRSSEQS